MTQFVCWTANLDQSINRPDRSAKPSDLNRSAQLAMIAAYLDRLVKIAGRSPAGLNRGTVVLLRRTTRVSWNRLRSRSVSPQTLLQLWQAVNDRLTLLRTQTLDPNSSRNQVELLSLDTAMLLLSDLQTPNRPRLFCPSMQPALAEALVRISASPQAQLTWQKRLLNSLANNPHGTIASACRRI